MSVTDGHLWLQLNKSFSTCFTPVFLSPAVVTLKSFQTHHTWLSSQSECHYLVSRGPWCMKWADVAPSSGPDSLSHLSNTGQPPSARGSREALWPFRTQLWRSTARGQPQTAIPHSHTENVTGVGHAAHKGKLERGQLRTSSHADSASGSLGPILEKSPWVHRWAHIEWQRPSKAPAGKECHSFLCCQIIPDHVPRFLSQKHHSAMTLSPPRGRSYEAHSRPQDVLCTYSSARTTFVVGLALHMVMHHSCLKVFCWSIMQVWWN